MRRSKNLLTGIKDVIAPARCMGCLREDSWLCANCRNEVARPPLIRREIKGMSGIVSVGSYGSPLLKRGVGWLKFKRVKELASPLGQLLISRLMVVAPLPQLKEQAALVPVPLHKRRLRQRGFNQSEELANVVKEYTGIPVLDVLVRKRATWTQTKLPPEMRQRNTQGAFTLNANELPGKRYWLLVDDVVTTGSTLSAAADALRLAPGKQVWGVTVARG